MEATETPVPLQYNITTVNVQIRKSIQKPIIFPLDFGQADDLVQNDVAGEIPEENTASSTYMLIFIPVASIALLIGLAAVARWRYRVIHRRPVNGKCQTLDNNNVLPKSEESPRTAEEFVPLKTRNTSTSSSSSTVSRNILIGGSRPIAVSMQIVSDTQNKEILKTSRADLYCEINSKESQRAFDVNKESTVNTVTLECEVLKDNKSANLTIKEDESKKNSAKNLQFVEEPKSEEPFPQRPRTLQVMTVVDQNTSVNTNNCSKGFPWTEQQWTPDADIVYEDIGSPVNAQKGGQDRLFPLMAKKKFKMKPKGLLERRGSNVALTISLQNDDKCSVSPPPSSKSPKPLVYLRTATGKLDPVQLHTKAADDQRLQKEFWEVPMNHPSEKHFSIPGYGTKNRYRSILPNPHSRVLLPVSPGGDPLSAYINANYVRGYPVISEAERRRQSEDEKENDARRMSIKRKAGFIATQGPMANTINDFWKMVWRENSTAIVMITKLKERKEKCAEYMPIVVGEKRTHGEFDLEVKNLRYADHYTVRTIEILNTEEEEGKVHTVMHYWCSEWPDHETPDRLRGLLNLLQEVDLRCPDMPNTDHGPVVVHCSAGIGRTGCFIAISIGCRQLRFEGKVDPLRIICQLRMDRGGMIQTWEQYQYVHVALSRYARILAGENVNTPLTGSSRTPDSLSSSRHTTPNSGDFKSPLNKSRLFSTRQFSELTPVEETEYVASDGEQKSAPKSNDLDGSIFSPRPANAKPKTHFSFLSADDVNAPPEDGGLNRSSDDCANADVEESLSRDISTTKKTKTCPSPLQLKLKTELRPAPVRDENWLVNGHVARVEKKIDDCQAGSKDPGIHTAKSPLQLFTADEKCSDGCSAENAGNEDLGKLKNILSPVSSGCQTPNVQQQQKFPIFMFPTPEK